MRIPHVSLYIRPKVSKLFLPDNKYFKHYGSIQSLSQLLDSCHFSTDAVIVANK